MASTDQEILVVITGSRTWPESRSGAIEAFMVGLVATSKKPVRFFVGDCPTGVDAIVLAVAEKHQFLCNIFVADWEKHGRAAGPIRNGEMISRNPHLVYAFRNNGLSNGTDDCIKQAAEAGIPTYIVRNVNEQLLQATATPRSRH